MTNEKTLKQLANDLVNATVEMAQTRAQAEVAHKAFNAALLAFTDAVDAAQPAPERAEGER